MPGSATIALVTGATSGLGREIARSLAGQGAEVLVHGRDPGRTEEFAHELRAAGHAARPHVADLADLAQVAALAERVRAGHPRLGILVNNAGVGGGPPPYLRRETGADGYELRLAVNYLAPVLLSRLLRPALVAGAPARVVNVGSVGQAPVDFDDVQMERDYHGAQAYFRSKFALAAFTFTFAAELRDAGVTVNCVHPASFMDTFQVREAGVRPWTPVAEGVPPVLNLATGPAGGEVTGQYFDGTRRARAHPDSYRDGERLRAVTEDLLAPFVYGPAGEDAAAR
jgi:NAD(P)-dependent dehydrogenase (short-subunit alcohol dehydrogenase family)